MRIDQAAVPVFARHETFHPRYGWLKKAVDAAEADSEAFLQPHAPVRLGVGKNMVRSIRHWGHAFRVLDSLPNPARPRAPGDAPSRIGLSLFGPDGWDPFLEDPGTLWLLHWWLLAPPSRAPVWWAAFNEFSAVQFTDEELLHSVEDHVTGVAAWSAAHPSAIKKDVACLLRMYAPTQRSGRESLDDVLDCPFRELGLLAPVPRAEGRTYRFVVGPKATLPPAIAAFASLDFMARTDAGAHTVTVSRLATEPGGPGRSFKLTEAALSDLLGEASAELPFLNLVAPAGVSQLTFDVDATSAANELLGHYFARHGAPHAPSQRLVAGLDGDHPTSAPLTLFDISTTQRVDVGEPPTDPVKRLLWTQRRLDAQAMRGAGNG